MVLAGVVAGGAWWATRPPPPPEPLLDASETEEVRAELAAINAAYQMEQLAMRVRYTVSVVNGPVLEEQDGEVRRDGDRLWWKAGHVELYQDATRTIVLDHEEQHITLGPAAAPAGGFKDPVSFAAEIIPIVGGCDTARVDVLGAERDLTLVCAASSFSRIVVTTRADHLITRLRLRPRPSLAIAEGQSVEMDIRYEGVVTDGSVGVPAVEELLPPRLGGTVEEREGWGQADRVSL